MSFARAFRLVALALGAVTVVLAAVCVVVTFRTRAFLADSTMASGRVIGLVARESCDHDREQERQQDCTTVYAPRVSFTTADERRVVFVSGSASSPASYQEGDRVEVRYTPDDPDEARISSFAGVWLSTLITGGLALVFAGLCAVWVVLAVRFRRA